MVDLDRGVDAEQDIKNNNDNKNSNFFIQSFFVCDPGETRTLTPLQNQILNLARLPIPPQGQKWLLSGGDF